MSFFTPARALASTVCAALALIACAPDHASGGQDATPRHRADSGSVDSSTGDAPAQDGALPDGAQTHDAGPAPAGWTCFASFWGDGDCDCGCGVLDLDCPGAQASVCAYNWCDASSVPVDNQNWLCTAAPDAGVADAAVHDAAVQDSAPVDAGPPPLQRDDSCTDLGVDRCAAGLACTPSGTCQEPCFEQHCADNANFCFNSSPTQVCLGSSYPHCVDGEGGLKLCRDIDLDFTQPFCPGGSSGYVWYYHSQHGLPQGCWDGWIEFTAAHICLSAVTDTLLTELGHDLTVITNDPAGYTDTSSCDYFSRVELNNLKVIGGKLEVGDVSGTTERSPLEVNFTRLELPVLEAVYGQMRYSDALHVTHINSPVLSYVGGFFILDNLPEMETVYLPGLGVIEGGLRIHDLPALTTLNLSHLRRIDGYVSIWNVPCIDLAVVNAIAAKATGPVSLNNVGTGTGCP
ncbi:MAG: hypothetical protein ABIJ09_19620 [Pseudomonadota bacterium]